MPIKIQQATAYLIILLCLFPESIIAQTPKPSICSLQISEDDVIARDDVGERFLRGKDVERKNVDQTNLSVTCIDSESIQMKFANGSRSRTFSMLDKGWKKQSMPKRSNDQLTSIITRDQPYTAHTNQHVDQVYWSGEDPTDGSSFDFILTEDGLIVGSFVDISNGTISQFRIDHNGSTYADVIPLSDFPDEIEPVHGVASAAPTDDEQMSNLLMDETRKLRGFTSPNAHKSVKRPRFEKETTSTFDDNGGDIDVMVVWTKEAECKNSRLPVGCTLTAQTENSMRALISLAVAETNEAFALSGVDIELFLVHTYRDEHYEESKERTFSTALSHASDPTDGVIDDIHAKRKEYGADVVSIVIGNSMYCGMGYFGPDIDYMFSVTSWACATGYYSFGHEIGHNLGALHDRGTANACSDTINSNYGYRDPSGGFRSIMAYHCRSNQCDNNRALGSCVRIKRFSNPTYKWNGKAVGSDTENVAGQMNEKKVTVAGYFPHGVARLPIASPSSSPNHRPSPVPTDTLSILPSLTPSSRICQDSLGRIRINGAYRNCWWVSQNNAMCQKSHVSSFCPVTCSENCKCFDTTGKYTYRNRQNKEKSKECKKIKVKFCKWNIHRSHCPVRCRLC